MYIIMKLSGKNSDIRVWRSLVARLTGGQEAAGSSPVTRTSRKRLFERIVSFIFFAADYSFLGMGGIFSSKDYNFSLSIEIMQNIMIY